MVKLTVLFKALSDQNRLRIVAALMTYEELCACQIIELMQVTGATVSRHMGVLIASGLVDSRKDGRWVYYRMRRELDEFTGLIQWMEKQLTNDSDITRDEKTLAKILACDPEDICRKQRSDKCCAGDEK
ncbi:MAG: metalloregulator ArsR/SmtB family transcription factor [Desulfocapsaceae bacterium]|jgi:ArsR family transcriptional regulator|nr:metalloregulator ArsR/SmtB family transcription factor [Desulfocapsaceae bacterium]